MDNELKTLLLRLARENEALRSHEREHMRRWTEDAKVQVEWLALQRRRGATLEEIAEYANMFAACAAV